MSHFTVLCIRKKDNERSYAEDLERYNENREIEPYVYQTKEETIEKGKDKINRFKDNEWVKDILAGTPKDEWIKKMSSEYKYAGKDLAENNWEYYSEIAKTVQAEKDGTIKDQDYYKIAIEDYEDWEIDSDGNILSTYNPESKWDWYAEGGRWSNSLIIKEEYRDKYDGLEAVDSAEVQDIDWGKMMSISKEEFEQAQRFWKYYVLGEEYPGTEEEKAEAIGGAFFASKEFYLKKYKTFDDYITSLCNWTTYAVMDDDGEWYSKGEMGYFGMETSTEDSEKEWEENFFNKFIEPLEKGDTITVVDCHM